MINILRLVSVQLAVNILCHSIVGFGFCCHDILPFTFNILKIKEFYEEFYACKILCPEWNVTSLTRIEKPESYLINSNLLTSSEKQSINSKSQFLFQENILGTNPNVLEIHTLDLVVLSAITLVLLALFYKANVFHLR